MNHLTICIGILHAFHIYIYTSHFISQFFLFCFFLFYFIVWEQQSKAILMLNKIIEKKQVKCHLYWPKKEGQRLNLPDVGLTVEFVTAENYKNFSKRLFRWVFFFISLLNCKKYNYSIINIVLNESSKQNFMTQKTQCISLELLMWNQQSRERSYNFTTLRYDNEWISFHAYCTRIKCQIICNSNNSFIIINSQHSGLILAFQVLPSHFYNF